LSAAIANGGSETDLGPGLTYFAILAQNNRLIVTEEDASVFETIYNGKAGVAFLWDFNALNGRAHMLAENPEADVAVVIPQDGAIKDGYATIINAKAKNPYEAALARDYLLSTEGSAGSGPRPYDVSTDGY
ncbi:MAG: hypothetical protein ACRC2O_04225, partial [Chitinophagaceae bacterium]